MIKVPKHNVRLSNTGDGLEDLKTNIKSMGLIEPIIVFENAGQYIALVGQRRLLAYLELNEECPDQGFDEIDCIVRTMPADDTKRAISLGENITHLPMSKNDLIRAATDLYNKCGNYTQVHERFGLSKYMVDKYVGLSRLPEIIKQAIQSGELHNKQKNAERIALDAVDALQYVPGGDISEDKVLEFARIIARKSNLRKTLIEEAKKNPLRDVNEIQRRADEKHRIPLNLYLSVELDSRLEQYSDHEAYDSKEEAAIDIIVDKLDTGDAT